MDGVIENIFQNDNTISGPKVKAAVTTATGATLALHPIQRAKQKLVNISNAQLAFLISELRPYLSEVEKHSPHTVTDVQVRVFYLFVYSSD